MPKTAKRKTVKAVKAWAVVLTGGLVNPGRVFLHRAHAEYEATHWTRGDRVYTVVRVEIRPLSPKPRSKR